MPPGITLISTTVGRPAPIALLYQHLSTVGGVEFLCARTGATLGAILGVDAAVSAPATVVGACGWSWAAPALGSGGRRGRGPEHDRAEPVGRVTIGQRAGWPDLARFRDLARDPLRKRLVAGRARDVDRGGRDPAAGRRCSRHRHVRARGEFR